MQYGYIYHLTCPITGSPRYVGQTTIDINTRLTYHKSKFMWHLRRNKAFRKTHKEAWFYSLYKQGLLNDVEAHLIAKCQVNDLDATEIYWIAKYKELGYDLTNTTAGGGQPRGHKLGPMSDNAKAAISAGGKLMWQRWRAEEGKLEARDSKRTATNMVKYGARVPPRSDAGRVSQKAKLSVINTGKGNPFYGKQHTEESKAKQSAAKAGLYDGEKNPFYGKQHDDDTKAKIKAARAAQVIVSRTINLHQHGIFVCSFTHIDQVVEYFGDVKKRAFYNRVTKGALFGDGFRLTIAAPDAGS